MIFLKDYSPEIAAAEFKISRDGFLRGAQAALGM
jgi:hypothetical protein